MTKLFDIEQTISDEINASFNGYYSSCPGYNGITVIENDPVFREFQVKFNEDGTVLDLICTYESKESHELIGKSLNQYHKLWNLVAKYGDLHETIDDDIILSVKEDDKYEHKD